MRVVLIGGRLALPHVPAQLLELSPHLCFCLAQVPGGSREDATFQAHFLAAAAWVMRDLVLLNIAANLQGQ